MAKKKPDAAEIQKLLAQLSRAGKHLPYGTFAGFPTQFDLQDANIGLLDFGINEVELAWLDRIYSGGVGCERRYERTLDDVARDIVGKETTFKLDNYDLVSSVSGFREAFSPLVAKFVSNGRPLIAYASPNWIFGDIVSATPGAKGYPFPAFNADMFIDGFKSLDHKDRIGALVIVDPSNPLGYRLSRSHVESIEEIARSNGIVPVFDEVFRGLQNPGERHSSSEHSHDSVVIETTSKRFGSRGLGVTWSLFPKSLKIDRPLSSEASCRGCSSLAAMVADALYTTGYDTRVREMLIRGTNAFVRGISGPLQSLSDKGAILTGFDGMPLFTYHFPEGFVDAKSADNLFSLHDYLHRTAGVTPGYLWISDLEGRRKCGILPNEETNLGLGYIRACPTKEPPQRLYLAGEMIGEAVAKYSRDPSSFSPSS